jgi:hypothetical protein
MPILSFILLLFFVVLGIVIMSKGLNAFYNDGYKNGYENGYKAGKEEK